MRTNLWLVFGMMLSTGLMGQELTNSPAANAIQPTATAEQAVPAAAPEVKNAAPAKPKAKPAASKTKKKSVAPKRAVTPPELRTVPLVPGPALVIASNVNVRAQASFKGEVLTKLSKGDQVSVVEEVMLKHSAANEPSAWAKIILPPSAKVFINSGFVNQADGAVTARRLNLRGGPGENYSVLGRLQRGDIVKSIGTKDGWTQIEPPTNAVAFIAAQYLKQEAPGAIAAATTTAAPPPTQPETAPATTAAPVQDTAPIATAPTTDLSAPTSTAPTAAAPATGVAATTAPADSASTSNAVAAAETKEEEEPPPPRIVQREGLVRGTFSIQAPTRYELWSPESGRVINYLHTTSNQLDLSRYKGLRIIVTGEESLDERWRNTPVITIQKIVVIE
jgi:hypothetical protein